MKNYLAFLLLFISSILWGQEIIIDKNYRSPYPPFYYDFYECKELEYMFEEGVANIVIIDRETIYIENESNTGASGIHISFKIDNKLNYCDLTYYTWDDVEDGSSIEFYIQEFKLNLNKNPFSDGINNLKGFYDLKIKSVYIPGEMLSKENVKEKTEIFTYKASFDCSNNGKTKF